MYGVSKINIEPSLMMISVQDAEFRATRWLVICRSSPTLALWWI